MIVDPNEQNRNKTPWPIKTFDNIGDNYGPGQQIKVRCVDQRGVYYNFCHRHFGDVFNLIPQYVTEQDPATGKPARNPDGTWKRKLLTAEDQFSATTMEKVDDDTPEVLTTAQAAINKMSDELNEAKIPQKRR